MIARRFVAVFYPSAEFDITTRLSVVAEHTFKTEGKVLTSPGWLAVYGKTTVEDDSAGSRALPALTAGDGKPPRAAAEAAELHHETTKPPPRYTEATLLSAMEGAGKLVEDEELAEAMKERGLGTPATRADTIDGLINQKYMERAQRELIPTAKAEQLIQFLGAVKADALTSPAMTGEWEFKLRQMEQGKFTRDEFMTDVADQTRGIVDRVKKFEEDDSVARITEIPSPTDGKPLRETLRGYKSQDGEVMIYKVIANRKMDETEVRDLLAKGQIGPLDGFRSKAGRPFSALLRFNAETKKAEFVFDGQRDASGAIKIDFTGLQPVAPAPAARYGPGAEVYETPQSYVVRKIENGEDKVLIRCSRRILARDIPREQFLKMLETGKTDLLDKFWSQRTRRPFNAFLVIKPDGTTGFEFAPRAPKDPNAPAKGRFGKKKKAAPAAAPPTEPETPAAAG
jgi:DNA topoisomerase-3